MRVMRAGRALPKLFLLSLSLTRRLPTRSLAEGKVGTTGPAAVT